jgi:hypothetical protein
VSAGRGRSLWAPRLLLVSTLLLVLAFAAGGALRSLLTFGWVVLALGAFVLEWRARRRPSS